MITIANQKGGVGKTTTAVNLAAALAQHGSRVLVIDLDPQGNASTALDVEHRAGTTSIYHVLVEDQPLVGIIHAVEDIPLLYCAPATIDLAGAEIELVPMVAREGRLSRALRAYDESQLDYILIDCPPSLGLLTVNALVAAAEVLIPIQCEYYALEGLEQLLRTVDLVKSHLNPELAVSTILLTMYDGRTRLASQVADEVREPLRRRGAAVHHPAQRAGLRGAQLRAVGDDLRSRVERRGRLPGGGPGDGLPLAVRLSRAAEPAARCGASADAPGECRRWLAPWRAVGTDRSGEERRWLSRSAGSARGSARSSRLAPCPVSAALGPAAGPGTAAGPAGSAGAAAGHRGSVGRRLLPGTADRGGQRPTPASPVRCSTRKRWTSWPTPSRK